jgi:hypothetical protein
MRRILLFFGLALGVALAAGRFLPAHAEPRSPAAGRTSARQTLLANTDEAASDDTAAPAADRSGDEAAIRRNIEAFEKAYNAADAKVIATLFLQNGQVVTDDGETIEGRSAIEQGFKELFDETP